MQYTSRLDTYRGEPFPVPAKFRDADGVEHQPYAVFVDTVSGRVDSYLKRANGSFAMTEDGRSFLIEVRWYKAPLEVYRCLTQA